MPSVSQAMFGSWSIDPQIVAGLVVAAVLYVRGWMKLHRVRPSQFPTSRLAAFLAGLLVFWIAVASPLDAFSNLLLSAHMIQHLLLMMVAPPLVLLGAPVLPMLRGLPDRLLRDGVGPFLASRGLRRIGRWITHPKTCWIVMGVTLIVWHVPAMFELALRSPGWHKFEHACFFGASLLFWWPVVRPFPSRSAWPLWTVPIYLLAADILNTAVAATLTFSERVLYPGYESVPRLFGTTAHGDQVAAGVLMWVPGSLIFLIPAAVIVIRLLSPTNRLVRPGAPIPKPPRTISLNVIDARRPAPQPFDLLNVPILGAILRRRGARRAIQFVMLAIAAAVVIDGFLGTQVSSQNLAGVLPWTYWRAFAVVGLLAAGNFFCMACPFTLARNLGRRAGAARRHWPAALRSKWLAIALLIGFFWATEALSLWDRPVWTAAVIVGYFVLAMVIDSLFRGASFCKYVCPIGQFQFVTSLVSPLEVKIRRPITCDNCTTHDCLRGRGDLPGCGTDLYLPRKVGNLDCTFCLDCVDACPHGNIGVMARDPISDLAGDARRSSIGRLSQRTDLAALSLVLTFAAFATAAAMTAPVVQWQDRVTRSFGFSSHVPVVSVFLFGAIVLLPMAVAGLARVWQRRELIDSESIGDVIRRFSHTLLPIGAAMWAGHYLFHWLAGYLAAWPVLQHAAGQAGVTWLGPADWSVSLVRVDADSMLVLQVLLLDAGLLASLYTMWRIARQGRAGIAAMKFAWPWALAVIGLFVIGVWIFLQPMQMRGLTEVMK